MGIEARLVSIAEIQGLVPGIDLSQVKCGFLVPKDGYVDPAQCARAFAGAARDLGVQFEFNTQVTGLKEKMGKIHGVETARGYFAADSVVLTAGPWTNDILKRAGNSLVMCPLRHQSARTQPYGVPTSHPVVRAPDISAYLRPDAGGYLYGFFERQPTSIDMKDLPPGFSTRDLAPPDDILAEARRRLTPIFPILKDLPMAESRQGITTFSPDGHYLLGPVPGVEGLLVAAGCSAIGIAGSAAIGLWLAQLILKGKTEDSLEDFALDRFGERGRDLNWVRKECEFLYSNYYNLKPPMADRG
jgi:4-methylaminobutanoate oxidase (formaldehyde-forming)